MCDIGALSFSAMTNLSKKHQQQFDEQYCIFPGEVRHDSLSDDGTRKFLVNFRPEEVECMYCSSSGFNTTNNMFRCIYSWSWARYPYPFSDKATLKPLSLTCSTLYIFSSWVYTILQILPHGNTKIGQKPYCWWDCESIVYFQESVEWRMSLICAL